MKRFFDSTSIHAVGACIDGSASPQQVETFLRFVAEIIAAERALFTGDPDGPVYPVTRRVIDQLSGLFESGDWFEFVQIDEPTFARVTSLTADDLLEDLKRFVPRNVALPKDFRPTYSPAMGRADSQLCDFLNNRNVSEMTARYSQPKSSNFAGRVLCITGVREVIVERFKNRKLSLTNSIMLAVAIRALAYDRLARLNAATYLPASGRLKRKWLQINQNDYLLSLRNSLPDGKRTRRKVDRTSLSLPDVVDALITVSGGSPRELVRNAAALRKDTAKIRLAFAKLEKRGDAMVLDATNLEHEYQSILDSLLGTKSKPQLLNTLLKTVGFTVGFSSDSFKVTPSFDDASLQQWLRYKKRRRQLHALATLFAKAVRGNGGEAYSSLINYSTGKV